MNLINAIEELRGEKEKLDHAIGLLEQLQSGISPGGVVTRKRRGRKSMSAEERQEVSARMRKYWADKLAGRTDR